MVAGLWACGDNVPDACGDGACGGKRGQRIDAGWDWASRGHQGQPMLMILAGMGHVGATCFSRFSPRKRPHHHISTVPRPFENAAGMWQSWAQKGLLWPFYAAEPLIILEILLAQPVAYS